MFAVKFRTGRENLWRGGFATLADAWRFVRTDTAAHAWDFYRMVGEKWEEIPNNEYVRELERDIVGILIRDGLAAGYALGVYDGEEIALAPSVDPVAILEAMFSVDDEYLTYHKGGKRVGWVRLVYGNGGWDVVADHTTNLGHVITGAEAFAEVS
jgi:hypothetical protein